LALFKTPKALALFKTPKALANSSLGDVKEKLETLKGFLARQTLSGFV